MALQNLVTSLQNNDAAGTTAALQSLKGASDWLNQQQSTYGVSINRITSAVNSAATDNAGLKARISEIRDTDIVQAATDLTTETTAQSAAFSAQARISGRSLFDYLG